MLTNKEFNEIYNKSLAISNRSGNCAEFQTLANLVIDSATIPQLIKFVRTHSTLLDIKKFGIKVLELGSVEDNFEYACIEGSDSKAHRDMIISSGNIEFNIRAGKQIKDGLEEEYVNKHGLVVLTGSAYENFKYLRYNKCKTLNKQAHFDVILKSKNIHINLICAKEVDGANVAAHAQIILDSKEVPFNMAFAKLQGSDTKKHLAIVARYGSAYDNFDVIQTFKNCDMINHIIKIFSSNDNDIKFECFRWLKKQGLYETFKNLKQIQAFIFDLRSGKVAIDDLTSDDTYNC